MRPKNGARIKVTKPLYNKSVPVGATGTVIALLGDPLMSFTVEWDDTTLGKSAFDTVTASRKLKIETEEVKDNE